MKPANFRPSKRRDLARQRNRLRRRFDPGALAAGVAFDHDGKRAAGGRGRLRQAGNDDGIVGGNRHVCLRLQRAEPGHLLFAEQIVADQDVVDPGRPPSLRPRRVFWQVMPLAPASICICASIGFLWVLICGPVGDAGRIAGGLDARDVGFDTVHVDDGAGRAVFAGDLGGEGRGHVLSTHPRSGLFYFFAQNFELQPFVFGLCQAPSAPSSAHPRPGQISCDPSCRDRDRRESAAAWQFRHAILRSSSAAFPARAFR